MTFAQLASAISALGGSSIDSFINLMPLMSYNTEYSVSAYSLVIMLGTSHSRDYLNTIFTIVEPKTNNVIYGGYASYSSCGVYLVNASNQYQLNQLSNYNINQFYTLNISSYNKIAIFELYTTSDYTKNSFYYNRQNKTICNQVNGFSGSCNNEYDRFAIGVPN